MAYLFQDLLNKSLEWVQTMADKLQQKSMDWLNSTVEKIQKTSLQTETFIKKSSPSQRIQTLQRNSIGKMYLFIYDPKTKDKLPYYDRYPLVFPIEYYNDGFLGINLHYLPPVLRAKLMNALYVTVNNKKKDESSRLLITYKILNNTVRFRLFRPCIKRYLFKNVKSPFINIEPNEWDIAVMLPTQRFIGADANRVWQDSRNKVR